MTDRFLKTTYDKVSLCAKVGYGKRRKQLDVQKYTDIMLMTYALHWLTWYIPSSDNQRGCAWWYMKCSCTYCVFRISTILFNERAGAITDHCLSSNDTNTYFRSKLYVQDISPYVVDGIRTRNLLIDNLCLTTSTPPWLVNFQVLNFRQWNWSEFSNHFKIISSYQHFQIQHVDTTFLVCNATSQQLFSWKNMRKSWGDVFCQKRLMIAFTAWRSLCYRNTFCRTFTAYIERIIDR